MILGIDHVGIAVRDVATAATTFSEITGAPAAPVDALPAQHVRVCFVPGGGAAGDSAARGAHAQLELLEPLDAGSPVDRFLKRSGEGMHHVCFAVDDVRQELARLADAGYTPIDAAPRRGHGGLVAFLHPKGAHGVLVELLERDDPAEREAPQRQDPHGQ